MENNNYNYEPIYRELSSLKQVQSVYPTAPEINEENNSNPLTLDYMNKLKQMRIKDFENDLTFLIDKIKHYNKLRRRWKKFDIAVRYFDIGIGSLFGIAGITLSVLVTYGIILIPTITVLIGTFPLSNTIIHGILNFGLIKRKLKKYNDLVKELEMSKYKLFLFHQKALHDNLLTDKEIETSKLIVSEIKNKILKIQIDNEIKDSNENKDNNTFLLGKIKEMETLLTNQPTPKLRKK